MQILGSPLGPTVIECAYDQQPAVELGLTWLGVHALQTDTVRHHLGLDDAAPT